MVGDISVRQANRIRIGEWWRARIAKARTIRACAKAGWGQCFVFFFLSAGRVTLLHETGFLHIKGIKIFGYEIVIEKDSEKNFKILEKNSIEALVIIIWRRKELSTANYQLLPNASTTFFTHIVFFFSLTVGHFAIFWVCALVPALTLRLGGLSEIHGQNSWKESLRPEPALLLILLFRFEYLILGPKS